MNKHYPHLADKLPAPSEKVGNIRSLILRWWAREAPHKQTRSVTCLKGGDQKGSLKPLSFLTCNHYPVVPMPRAVLLGGLDEALDLPVSEIFTAALANCYIY
jgi:hypothetical protein